MPPISYHERLVTAFVELADTLTTDFDVIAFLHTLTEHCVDLLDVRAAGVLLATPQGHIVDAAASDADTRRLELNSIEWEEGPCHDCFHSREPAGELAQHRRVSVDEAFTLLRDHARAHQRLLADLAREVIEGIADQSLLAPPPAERPRPQEETPRTA
ncbi:ANTAR domain-containing protein [Streptacidiphilus sp. PAMC 29251]